MQHRRIWGLLIAGMIVLTGCGGGGGSNTPTIDTKHASTVLAAYRTDTKRTGVSAAIALDGHALFHQPSCAAVQASLTRQQMRSARCPSETEERDGDIVLLFS